MAIDDRPGPDPPTAATTAAPAGAPAPRPQAVSLAGLLRRAATAAPRARTTDEQPVISTRGPSPPDGPGPRPSCPAAAGTKGPAADPYTVTRVWDAARDTELRRVGRNIEDLGRRLEALERQVRELSQARELPKGGGGA